MTQSLKDSLRGCYEIPLFLKEGIERFENSRAAFLQSLLIPLLLIPMQLPVAGSDPELAQYPLLTVVVILSYRVIVSTAFFLGGVWLLTWPLERNDRFYRFATASNWIGLTGYVLLLPYFILIMTGAFSAEQLGTFLLFLIGFFMTLTAFTARHALNVHWAIAAMIGMGALLSEILAAIMIGGLQGPAPS